ncbi:thiol reductant ABC exporter subunit CydD [Billgrantia diversa]|uniref:thiol reductant ABC exporter subunit CydD n=1 Tax=Halomonas sp. MCCC 1A13316 TaxID=2733487 RepID=UPI0018A6A1DA|nr:thiol reductant ABC exporter subunit CydD [Halomonas sp. MCCC 1A13316]QOR40407.1 thiol reductant ABC exporter subunit CydD [Halomonas sp. MCCC 1A13316]
MPKGATDEPLDPGQRLRRCLTPQRWRLRGAFLLALGGCILLIVQSWLLASIFAHAILAWQGEVARFAPPVAWLAGLAACLVLRPLLQYGREVLTRVASRGVRAGLRGQLLESLGRLGPARRNLGSDGALGTQVLEHIDALDGYVSRYHVQRQLVIAVPLMLVLVVSLLSPLAAGLMLLTAPLVPLFMVLVGRAAAEASQRQLTALARLGGSFLDLARGMATLKRLNATSQAARRIADASEAYRSRTLGVLRLAFLSGAVLEFFAALAIALVALYLGLGLLGLLPWAQGEVPVPYQGALLILLLAPEFYAPLRQLGADYHARAEAEGAMQELIPLLDAETWQPSDGQAVTLDGPPSILCRGVTVAGEGGRRRLAPLDFESAGGERWLVQGESGCGKSSLLEAMLGFVPYEGSLCVDGRELSSLSRESWQRHLGYLGQQPPVMRGSVGDNLRLASPEAGKVALIAVLEQVGLWSLLAAREGLDTILGERGKGLSGGQLQRLALAQLLLREAPLWLFDEPTAHLDPDSARELHGLLERLSRGRTVIIVSHEAEGLEWVDGCLRLDDKPDGRSRLCPSDAQGLLPCLE